MVRLKFLLVVAAVLLMATALSGVADAQLKAGKQVDLKGVLICLDCEISGRKGAEAQNIYLPGHTHALKLADGRLVVFVATNKEIQRVLDEHKLNLKRVKVKGRAFEESDFLISLENLNEDN